MILFAATSVDAVRTNNNSKDNTAIVLGTSIHLECWR